MSTVVNTMSLENAQPTEKHVINAQRGIILPVYADQLDTGKE